MSAVRLGGGGRRFQLFRRITLVTSATGFVAVAGVVSLGFNARALGLTEFGTLATIQAFVSLVSALTTFETWQPVIRLGSRPGARLGPILSCGIMMDAMAATVAGLGAMAVILLAGGPAGISEEHSLLALIYSASLFGGVAGTPKGYFRLKGEYGVLAGNQVAQGVVNVGASAALWALNVPLLGYVIVFAAIAAFYNLSLLVRLVLHARGAGIRFGNPLRARTVRRFLPHFTRIAIGNGVLNTLLSSRRNLSQLLVASLLGSAATGVYAIAARLASMVTKLNGPLNQVLYPEVVRMASGAPSKQLARAISQMTIIFAGVSGIIVIAGALASELLAWIVVGPGYTGVPTVFVLLLAAECFDMGGIPLSPLIQSRWGTKPLVAAGMATVLLLIGLGNLLAERFGAAGLAAAAAAATATYYGAMTIFARLVLKPANASSSKIGM